MKILITGACPQAETLTKQIEALGHSVIFTKDEKTPLKEQGVNPLAIEGVIANGLFLYNPIEDFLNLKYIQLTSAGYDRVPMDYIVQKGINIYNARGVYSVPMAEFAICGVLELYKKSMFFFQNQKNHEWLKHREITELSSKTVSIVGFGSVGAECAKRFKAFDTTILAVDIQKPQADCFDEYYNLCDIKKAISLSDVVILTLPLTNETKNLINKDIFDVMKNDSILVNIARGPIVCEKDLINSLKNKTIGGAVLDVFCEEPLEKLSPLWEMENVLITPHNSFIGDKNSKRLHKVILDNLKRF